MASTFADLLRQRLAQGGAQSVPQPSQGYGGSTPGAVPVTPDQARVEAAQRVAAALLNAKLRQVQSGGGAATPQSQMTQPQLQAAGPAYGSQAARVASAPSVQAQPGIVPDIRKDTYGGVADLQAQQSAANYVEPQPTQQFSTTPVVPQAQDIRLLESNVNLPMTAEEATASLAKPDMIAGNEQFIADTQQRIDARTQELIAQGYDPMRAEMIAKQEVTDANLQWTRDNAANLPAPGPLEMISEISDWYDAGRQAIVGEMGQGAYNVATGSTDSYSPGWGRIAPANWGTNEINANYAFGQWAQDPANAAIIRNAYENGFQADLNSPRYTGGQAVWELFINGRGMLYKTMSDLFNDPGILTAAAKPTGTALKTSGLDSAADGNGIMGAIKYATGSLLEAPQNVLDATVDAPFNILGAGISRVLSPIAASDGPVMRNVKGAFQSLFSPTDRQLATDQRELIEGTLEYGERVYGGYEPTTGPGGPGSSGTPNGKPQQPTNPGGAPTGGTTYQKPGEYGYRLDTTNDGWKTWAILNPDGSVYSDGHKWSPPTGPEKNFLENEVRRVVANLNRPAEVAQMQSAGIVVPPDSWDWADPTRFRFTSWGNDQTTRDLPFRMTHDLRIPQETRQAMVDELTPRVEAHVQVMNDIDVNVVSQLKKKLPEGAGEAAKQAGHDIAVPIKTMEMLRFYAEDVFPVWQNHMGAIDESAYVFRYGDTPNPKDVNSLLEHALFGTRDTVTMIEKNGKMVPQVDASGTASQSRRSLREMGGKIEGVPATDVARNISEQRAKLFGEESLSQNASAAKSRATRARAAAVPQEVKVEAAATDMGAGRVPQVVGADAYTVKPTIDPVTVVPAKDKRVKPFAQLNLRATSEDLKRAIDDDSLKTITPAGFRVTREGPYRTVWAGTKKDANEVSARIMDTGTKVVIQSGNVSMDAGSLGEAIAMADDFLLGKIGSPTDVKVAKRAATETTETLVKQTPGGNTLEQQVVPGDTTGFLNAFNSNPEIVGGQFEIRQDVISGPWEVRRVGDDTVIASFPQEMPVIRNGRGFQPGHEKAIAKADELLAGGSTPPDTSPATPMTLAELDAEIAAYEAIPTFESKVGTRTSTTAYEKRTTLKAMKERRAKLESSLGIVPPVESPPAQSIPDFGYRTASLDNLKVSVADFQNRKSDYSAESVDNILNNYDPRIFDPIEVAPNGDGSYTILSGHSRHEAWKRMAAQGRVDPNAVPIRVQQGTPEELRLFAQTSNTRGTPNTPVEKGKLLNNLMASGKSWDEAIRAVNVSSAEGKRLIAVTKLSSALQEDIDANRLSLRMGALLGDSIDKGVITVTDADQVFLERIVGEGISESQLRVFLEAAAIAKDKMATTQNDMFGMFSIMSMGIRDTEELVRIQKELTKQQDLLTKAGKSSEIDDITRSGLNRAVGNLQRKLDDILTKMGRSPGFVPPSVRQSMEMDRNFSRLIQEREGAVTGLGLDDVLANRDSSPIGIALRLGVIDQETYAGLSRIVTWGQRYMPLYSAYEQLRDSGMAHREAVDTLMNVLAPFPEMKAAPTWLAKWWRRVLAGPDSWYMTTLTAMRQQQQYNLANGAAKAIADQIGNSYTLLVTGAPTDALKVWTNPRTYANFIRIERGDKARLATLNHMDRMDTLGIRPRHGVLELNAGRTEAADGSEMILREKTKGTPIGDSRVVGAAYGVLANKAIKDIRNAGDRNARYTHYMGRFFREVKKGRAKFYNLVRNRAEALGQDADEWVRLVKGLGDDFSNDDILRVLGDERLARDWREILGQADRTAYRSVNEKMFSYRQMKIDEKLRYVVFYHYWMSRAFLLHSKTAMKNPWLMNAYLNTWQGLQNEAEEKGYPPSVVGTLRFLTSTEGFQSYMNPIGVTVPFDILIDQGNTDPSVADWLRSHGLFFNPIVDAALGVMGMTSRVSDLTQTKAVRRGIKAYVNWMNSNGYENAIPDQIAGPNELVQDPIDIIQQRITQKANDWWSSGPGMEGWAQEFTQPDGYELDLVSSILMTQMEEALGPNSGWSDAEWDQYLEAQEAIMLHRDGNEYADAAVEAFSDANAEVALISAIAPGGLQPRYAPRDEDMALRDEGNQDARDRRTLATSGSPDDTALTVGINRLEDIGTESGRNAYSAWNEIANLEELPLSAIGTFIEIDGEQIYAGDIANMSYDQRAELADRWVSQYGATEDLASYREERDLYLMKHPEVGDFKEFQKGVYGFDGGPRAWREQYAKTDDDFRAAMEEKEARLRETHTQQEIIDRELDQWAASQEAYKVANGVRDNSYDAPVEPKVPDYGFAEKDAPGASGGSTGSSETKTPIEKTRTTITSYNDKIAKAVAVMNASGYSVTADDLIYANDYYKQAWGLFDIPSMPYDANLYWQWVLLQPSGADTSVDAYLKVLEASGYSVAA